MSLLICIKRNHPLQKALEFIQPKYPLTFVHDRGTLANHLQQPFQAIFIHAEIFADVYPWEWISELNERQPQAKVIICPSEDAYDSLWTEVLERLSYERKYMVMPMGCSTDEAIRILMDEGIGSDSNQRLYSSIASASSSVTNGKIAAVWPAAAKDGASTIASSTAISLARNSPLRIGLLDLNLKNPELRVQLHLTDRNRSNAVLRPKLSSGTLLPEDLWNAAIPYRKASNLRILPGTFRRDTASDITPDMMDSLLSACRAAFDITLIDVSADPDNAATICAVRSADFKWLVASNRPSSYLWNWSEWYECYWKYCGLTPDQIMLVLNRNDSTGEKAVRIAELLHMRLAGVVPNVPGGAGLQATKEGKPLYGYSGADEFKASIDQLASSLHAAAGGVPMALDAKKTKGGFATFLASVFNT